MVQRRVRLQLISFCCECSNSAQPAVCFRLCAPFALPFAKAKDCLRSTQPLNSIRGTLSSICCAFKSHCLSSTFSALLVTSNRWLEHMRCRHIHWRGCCFVLRRIILGWVCTSNCTGRGRFKLLPTSVLVCCAFCTLHSSSDDDCFTFSTDDGLAGDLPTILNTALFTSEPVAYGADAEQIYRKAEESRERTVQQPAAAATAAPVLPSSEQKIAAAFLSPIVTPRYDYQSSNDFAHEFVFLSCLYAEHPQRLVLHKFIRLINSQFTPI